MYHGAKLIALSMLSLVAGSFLLMRAWKEEVCGKLFLKIVGYGVVVVSLLLILAGASRVLLWGNVRMMGDRGMRPGMMRGEMWPGMVPGEMPHHQMMRPQKEEGKMKKGKR